MLNALIPPGLDASVATALLGTSFAASFITIAFGLGGGILLLSVMASLMPPAMLIPVHGMVQSGSNAGRAALMMRFVSWPNVGVFTVGTIIGASIGGLVAVNLQPAFVQIGVGLFVIWSVLSNPPAWLHRMPALTGAFSSFLTMFFGATGPFVATFVRSLGMDRHGFVATHATLMTVQHVAKTVVFGLVGIAFGPWLLFCAAMIAAGFLGTIAGRLVLNRISDQRFQKVLNAILLVLALRLIWQGAAALSGA